MQITPYYRSASSFEPERPEAAEKAAVPPMSREHLAGRMLPFSFWALPVMAINLPAMAHNLRSSDNLKLCVDCVLHAQPQEWMSVPC